MVDNIETGLKQGKNMNTISKISNNCCILMMCILLLLGIMLNSCRPDPVMLNIDDCSLTVYNYIGIDSIGCAKLKFYNVNNNSDIIYAVFTIKNQIIVDNKSKYDSRKYYLLSEKVGCDDSVDNIKLSLIVNNIIVIPELNKDFIVFNKRLFNEYDYCIAGENISTIDIGFDGDRYDGVEYCGFPCLRLTPINSTSVVNNILTKNIRSFIYRSQSGYCFILDNKKILKFLQSKKGDRYFMLSIDVYNSITHRKRTIYSFQKI